MMGITFDGSRFLCALRATGVSFEKTLTLGRQKLMVDPKQIDLINREFPTMGKPVSGANEFSEAFMRGLYGSKVVDAIDANDYEGAKHVTDMNFPIGNDLDEQYDLVVDGGTLEHVFHLTTAMANAMRMVKTGGWFVSLTIGNGFMGHGFYQLSPELFFRSFREQSGFTPPLVIAQPFPTSNLAVSKGGRWYRVTDPESIKKRVLYSASNPLALFVAAKKSKHLAEPFKEVPQQSDYQSLWNDTGKNGQRERRREQYEKIASLPGVGTLIAKTANRYLMFRNRSLRNRSFFKPVSSRELSGLLKQLSA